MKVLHQLTKEKVRVYRYLRVFIFRPPVFIDVDAFDSHSKEDLPTGVDG